MNRLLLLIAALVAPAVYSQTPDVSNAKMETRSITGDPVRFLDNLVASESGPLWFGYAVASQDHNNNSCCWDDNGAGCRLEGSGTYTSAGRTKTPVKLEGSQFLLVLYRVANHAIEKIHPVSETCPLDAGGSRFIWLTGVPASASLTFLGKQVEAGDHKQADTAILTISMHADAGADQLLERYASPGKPDWLREKALFWIANSRGAHGFAVLQRVAETDQDANIREKVMFDLTLSKQPEAIDELIRSAKHDESSHVRGQALFWLAQKAAAKSSGAIRESIDNDPDTEVKKKAVFALQQLPKDQGIPLLIQVAKTNRNLEVRKQAMFWLGQSGDPRAAEFLEQVVKGTE